jgi:hypothetical protein
MFSVVTSWFVCQHMPRAHCGAEVYSIVIEEKQAHVVPVCSKIRIYPSTVTNPGRRTSKCKCYPHEVCDECMPKHI